MKLNPTLLALLITYITSSAQAPTFSLKLTIPVVEDSVQLQNPWAGGINSALWIDIDLDGDGIHDLLMYDRFNDRISPFINSGASGSHAFHYDPQYINRFPNTKYNSWMLGYDYNCDGRTDLFVLDSMQDGISVYRNDYNMNDGLIFTFITYAITEENQFFTPAPDKVFANSAYIPALIDVDNDGDMDILTFNSTPNGKIAWHRNYSMEDYGICDSLDFKLESQCWGNFRLSLGSNSVAAFHDSCFQMTPQFSEDKNYEIMKRDDTLATLFAFDNDGDGSKDLLLGDLSSSRSLFIHNAGTPQIAEMDSQEVTFPAYDTAIAMYEFNRHSYIDVDNDSVKDLLVSAGFHEDKHSVWFYKNTGTTSLPNFNFQRDNFLQDEMIDVGESPFPVFFDEDNDGLLDLIIGNTFSQGSSTLVAGLSLYRNIGTTTSPAFQLVTHQYANVNTMGFVIPIAPAFGDLDGDGDQDMILGTGDGKLYYFDNSGGAGNPANFSLTISNYMNIDVGNNSVPQIIDLDRDGKLDLVIGEKTGILNFYNNLGTSSGASFTSAANISPLGNVNVQTQGAFDGYAVPFIYDDGGQYKMLVSCALGDVYYYTNIEGNLTGTFTLADTLISRYQGIRPVYNLAVSGADINGDTKTDMVVGLAGGGLQIYYEDSSHDAVTEYSMRLRLFTISPNPANQEILVRSTMADNFLCICNDLGEVVCRKRFADADFKINVSDFPDGVYFVTINSLPASETKELIIIH